MVKYCPTAEELESVKVNVVCEVKGCDKIFKHTSALNMHLTHTHRIGEMLSKNKMNGETNEKREYHCPVTQCIYNAKSLHSFTGISNLKQHYLKVHADKKYLCNLCKKGFGVDSNRRRHEQRCGVIYKCGTCDCPYTTVEATLTHCKRKGHNPPPECLSQKGKIRKGTKKEAINNANIIVLNILPVASHPFLSPRDTTSGFGVTNSSMTCTNNARSVSSHFVTSPFITSSLTTSPSATSPLMTSTLTTSTRFQTILPKPVVVHCPIVQRSPPNMGQTVQNTPSRISTLNKTSNLRNLVDFKAIKPTHRSTISQSSSNTSHNDDNVKEIAREDYSVNFGNFQTPRTINVTHNAVSMSTSMPIDKNCLNRTRSLCNFVPRSTSTASSVVTSSGYQVTQGGGISSTLIDRTEQMSQHKQKVAIEKKRKSLNTGQRDDKLHRVRNDVTQQLLDNETQTSNLMSELSSIVANMSTQTNYLDDTMRNDAATNTSGTRTLTDELLCLLDADIPNGFALERSCETRAMSKVNQLHPQAVGFGRNIQTQTSVYENMAGVSIETQTSSNRDDLLEADCNELLIWENFVDMETQTSLWDNLSMDMETQTPAQGVQGSPTWDQFCDGGVEPGNNSVCESETEKSAWNSFEIQTQTEPVVDIQTQTSIWDNVSTNIHTQTSVCDMSTDIQTQTYLWDRVSTGIQTQTSMWDIFSDMETQTINDYFLE